MTDERKIDLDDVSFDAKVLAAAWFGMGMKTTVTTHLRESRPAARTQQAIDELIAKGVVSVEPFNEFGGRVYKPLVDCRDASRWLHGVLGDTSRGDEADLARWKLHEKIDEDQAYELMTPYGQGVWDKEKRGRKPSDNPYDKAAAPDDHARWLKGYRKGVRA